MKPVAYRLRTLLLLLAVVPAAQGIWLNLGTSGTKCVWEELQSNVVVVGDYAAFIAPDQDENSAVYTPVSVKVTSPFGNDLHHERNVTTGQFLFTTTESGTYEACFQVWGDHHHGGRTVNVGIDWKTGIFATKDHWDAVAKKEHIQGLELELRKLESEVVVVHEKSINLRNREAVLRRMSELTNAKVAWSRGASIGICMMVSVLQVYHLKRYFKNNELI